MTKEELEEATEIILDSIMNSNLSNYTKIELLINMKTFLKDYKENINILSKEEVKKKWLK